MKKILLLLVFLLFSAAIVTAISLKDTGNAFSSEEFIVVVGPSTHALDVQASSVLSRYFESKGGKAIPLLSDEVSSAQKQSSNLLIVGGPCANPFWNDFSEETCESWNFKNIKGIMKAKEQDGRTVLLIAGTVADDTVLMAQKFTRDFLTDSDYSYEALTIFLTESEKEAREKGLYRCGNARCDPEENYEICSADCNPTEPEKFCNAESCPSCGNNICDAAETYTLCPSDCTPTCGNSICETSESFDSCRWDCS